MCEKLLPRILISQTPKTKQIENIEMEYKKHETDWFLFQGEDRWR